MALSLSDLKQEIMRINNTINQEIFGVGLRRQRVDVIGTKIVVLAENRRVPALAALDNSGAVNTRQIDLVLLDAYKKRLKELIQPILPTPIRAVLKDYDPPTELAGTIIVTQDPLDEA